MTYDIELRNKAKSLRNRTTIEEQILWQYLRKKAIKGIKFRRQHIINGYIVDFCAPKVKLIIEIDGGYHRKYRNYDKLRDKVLSGRGLKILRFWDAEINKDIKKILQIINREIC